jgi:hypothetical protein
MMEKYIKAHSVHKYTTGSACACVNEMCALSS